MATLTPNELLDWLVENQFLGEARAQPFRSPPASYADAHALVRDLIQRSYLTPYQVNQILQGKGTELLVGPYRLLERIGEGAMGQVFKAWNPKLERLIAIKMIHKEHLASKKAMDRFRREMETASHLRHPNIVLVRDADEVDNRPYLVMDYVDGIDLSRMVKQGGPLQVWQAAEYIRQGALGLQHAFERGVIHRDIKPGNLLLSNEGVVKILDFGLARFENITGQDNRLTQFGSVLGTVDYIAPEQAENAQAADVRADIYSLGCSLFFVLAGKAPFPGSTIVERVSAAMIGGPPSIRAIRPDVPPALDAVLQKMMARSMTDRYQVPQEAAAALEPFCDKDVLAAIPLAEPALVAAPPDMPLARPVAAHAAPPRGDPFAFNFNDPEEPTPAPPPPVATPVSTEPARSPPWRRFLAEKNNVYLAAGGGGLLFLLLLLFMVRGCGTPKGTAPDASIDVLPKEAELTIPPSSVGKNVNFRVAIQRNKFTGPVHVQLARLPKNVQSARKTIPADKSEVDITIMVSFGVPEFNEEIRILASADANPAIRGEAFARLKFPGAKK